MGGKIGEVDYDEQVELKFGVVYLDNDEMEMELLLIDNVEEMDVGEEVEELEMVQFEVKVIVKEICKLILLLFKVYDGKMKIYCNI